MSLIWIYFLVNLSLSLTFASKNISESDISAVTSDCIVVQITAVIFPSWGFSWAETKNERTFGNTEKISRWQKPWRHDGLGQQVTTTTAMYSD